MGGRDDGSWEHICFSNSYCTVSCYVLCWTSIIYTSPPTVPPTVALVSGLSIWMTLCYSTAYSYSTVPSTVPPAPAARTRTRVPYLIIKGARTEYRTRTRTSTSSATVRVSDLVNVTISTGTVLFTRFGRAENVLISTVLVRVSSASTVRVHYRTRNTRTVL